MSDGERPVRANGRLPRARKRFGQHFLEPAWVAKLVDAVEPASEDVFVEIGPGRGALTVALAPRVRRIIAIEIDRDLARALPSRVPENVHIVEADFLSVDLTALLWGERPPFRVIGNLPYNVASPILFALLGAADEGRRLQDATLMLQREVADRLVARPGSGDYGALSVQVAVHAHVERLLTLPPGAFRPPPKVMSAVVRLRFRPLPVDIGDPQAFERVVRGVFLQRRKTIANALIPVAQSYNTSAADLVMRAGIDPRKRPQELTVAEMAALARAVL